MKVNRLRLQVSDRKVERWQFLMSSCQWAMLNDPNYKNLNPKAHA